ncbi:MAG: 3-methyl-2-oxobutanoate hydroxymethyltransferase [Candidatus Humimicrobiia bacterium]
MREKKVTINNLLEMKRKGEKIAMVTAYDYHTAVLADRAGMDVVLIGDSLGMTMLGYESTLPVTMNEMIIFSKAVTRGCKRPLVVGDMPYMTYQISIDDAMRNAGRFMSEAGTDAIKLEGGKHMAKTVEALVKVGIPVMGHIGLTPQSMAMLGGFKVQGKTAQAAVDLLDDAIALENAGSFFILLELVPSVISKVISERLTIPTVSIGSGPDCDGQLLIFHDLVGLFEAFTPKHVKKYANLSVEIENSFKNYIKDVKEVNFPTTEHSFKISEEEKKVFLDLLSKRENN